MKVKGFVFFLVLLYSIVAGSVCSAQIYKWVDEKGTVHFSDSPVSGIPPGKDQSQGKVQDKNPVKPQDKGQGLEKKQEKPIAKEGPVSLKHLEIGNRYIPEDMKKYGPAGGPERPRGADAPSASAPRSSS